MKGRRLLFNTALMTAVSVALRAVGLVFQVYLSKALGASGIGVFQLVMSVYAFAATVAISGIRFATTRIVSEEVGRGREAGLRTVMRKSLTYAAGAGCAAAVLLFAFSDIIGTWVIGSADTVLPLRLLSAGLPFLSAGAALGGYFTGVARVAKSSAVTVTEELSRIGVSMLLISLVPRTSIELTCAAAAGGCAAGEIISFAAALALYRGDVARYEHSFQPDESGAMKRLSGIAVPLALAAYARTALNTLQNVLIPNGLQRSGASRETALAGYGTIQGMVFPIVTFPAVLFASVSELVVPELTEEQVRGRDDRISASAVFLLKACLAFSIGVMGALYTFSGDLGELIYQSPAVGAYIRALAFLMPIMYMDTVTDGMLRGLGQHLYSMRLNIVDSVFSSAFIWLLLPRFALGGYVFILYASELFNFSLSMHRLTRITRIEGVIIEIPRALIAALGAGNLIRLILNVTGAAVGALNLIVSVILYIAAYAAFLAVLGSFGKNELRQLRFIAAAGE